MNGAPLKRNNLPPSSSCEAILSMRKQFSEINWFPLLRSNETFLNRAQNFFHHSPSSSFHSLFEIIVYFNLEDFSFFFFRLFFKMMKISLHNFHPSHTRPFFLFNVFFSSSFNNYWNVSELFHSVTKKHLLPCERIEREFGCVSAKGWMKASIKALPFMSRHDTSTRMEMQRVKILSHSLESFRFMG